MAFDVLGFLVHADVVLKCAASGSGGGPWYVAFGSSLSVPNGSEESAEDDDDLEDIDGDGTDLDEKGDDDDDEEDDEDEEEEQAVALCIAQTSEGTLYGAIAWYDVGTVPTSLDGALPRTEDGCTSRSIAAWSSTGPSAPIPLSCCTRRRAARNSKLCG